MKHSVLHLLWRQCRDKAHRTIVKARNCIVSYQGHVRSICHLACGVQALFGGTHEAAKKRFRRSGKLSDANEQLALDRFKHNDPSLQITQIVVIPCLVRHIDTPVAFEGWENIPLPVWERPE